MAMQNLGTAYTLGRGAERDDAQSAQWWQKAADAGSLDAMLVLATAYNDGIGVARDQVAAARWWTQGANLGDPRAQHQLALAIFRGEGVARDLTEAYKWLYIAASISPAEDRVFYMNVRDSMGTNMTGEELAEAQRRAREWRPQPQPTR